MSKLNKYESVSRTLTYLICSRAHRFSVEWEEEDGGTEILKASLENAFDNDKIELTKTQLVELIKILKDIELQMGDKLK